MRTIGRLAPLLRPYWISILLALAATIALTGAYLAVPYIIRQVIDIGLAKGEARTLQAAAVTLIAIGLARAGLLYSQRYLSESIATRIGYDLRNRLYNHLQYLSFSFHDHAQTGQLISRCIEDVRSIERFTGYGVVELLQLCLLFIGAMAVLVLQEARLASLILIPLAVLVVITVRFGRRVSKYFLAVDVALGDLSAAVQENVSGVQVVRAFGREDHEIERFERRNRTLFNARLEVIGAWSRVMPTTHFLVALGTILIILFGGAMVLGGQMTIGEVVAFEGYLLLLAIPARQLTWTVNAAGEAVAGVQRVFEILDTAVEIASPVEAVKLPRLAGRFTFQGVSFQYRGRKLAALEDINLQVEPNQVVALIGPTGSGKTSLVNLIPRFYDVTQGAILVDGHDIRQVDLASLRRQIGIVLQTSLLFSTTIAENIAFGRPEATLEEIESAARAAQAHDFIQQLPQGYQTVVGERGVTLSGGQRQRVCIARALLLDPRVLILDDSTSSVDTETERLIQQALAQLMRGRTTFVIAHRLSTVRRADLILVMKDGRIVERGNHEELLRLNGLYRHIYDLQLRDQDHPSEDEMEALDEGHPAPVYSDQLKAVEEDC